MKNKKQISVIVLGIVVASLAIFFFTGENTKSHKVIKKKNQEEDITALNKIGVRDIQLAGRIQSRDQTKVSPEVSAKIKKIYVKEGDRVKKGEVLVSLENINQRLSVKNAQVAVNSAKLQLQKLLNNNSLSDKNSVLSNVVNQQEKAIMSAKNAYLNADLRAYPEDYDETTPAPIISGNYNCEKEGQYIIDVYGSAASSGASMKVSGLENDVISVSTDYPVKLGTCGLEIVFSEGFRKNRIWIVSVPNTRSAQYITAKKQYETILAGKNLAIKTSIVLPEDISAAKDRLSQAQLGLELALTQLAKTKVRAPFDGQITKTFADVGNLASAYIPLLEMTSPGFEISADISNEFLSQIHIDDTTDLEIEDEKYHIQLKNIIKQSQKGGQKIPLRFEFIDIIPENIFDGMFVKIPLHFEQDTVSFVEANFVGFGYHGPFVNCSGVESLVSIKNEKDTGYWIEFIDKPCNEKILLPYLLKNN